MSAYPVHLVKQTNACFVKIPLNLEGRELISYYTQAPSRGIWRCACFAIGQYLRRRNLLISGTKGAEATFTLRRGLLKI